MNKELKKLIGFTLLFAVFLTVIPSKAVSAEVGLKEQEGTVVITGFEAFDVNENALHLIKEEKPSLTELYDMMPDTLNVYINGALEAEPLEVDWFCVGDDYEASESFYFQFSPSWDEERYVLSEEIDLLTEAPYMAVFFQVASEGISTFAVTNNSYEPFIFDYLTDQLGYNTAAACGAMANIYSESAFIPINLENKYEKTLGFSDATYTMAVDNGSYANFVRDSAGYGLCQWTFWSRKQGLLDLVKSRGVSIGDAGTQLDFLHKELMAGATGKYMKAAPNTEQGCYDVGYYFCQNFERPAQVADEKSIARGNLARNYYWEEYSNSIDYTISIKGHNKPGNMNEGSSFAMTGTITSGARIRNLVAGVFDVSGTMVMGKNFAPNVKSYDLSSLNSSVLFQNLKPGCYYYKVSATNADRTKTFINQFFMVLPNSQTIKEGTSMIVPKVNRSMVVSVENHSKQPAAKIWQENNTNSAYQYFEITYVGYGYYTLKNKGTGLYLEVPSGKITNGTSVQQGSASGTDAQKWQFLPAGDGYCIIPKGDRTYCLVVENGATTSGTKLKIAKNNAGKEQIFQLISGRLDEVFRDISVYDWYIEYLEYVYENGLMSGNDGLFQPNESVTKAMVAQVLYNIEGKPSVTDKSVFKKLKDVYENEWYGNAVAWAYNSGIITGDLNTKNFSPNAAVTREQLALMFYRYAVEQRYPTKESDDLEGLKNAENVSNWAADGMKWSVGAGLIGGVEIKDSNGNKVLDLAPQSTATRAQMAAILKRFCEKYDLI